MSAPMIELAKVSKSFGAHQVLRGVDLSVGRSEVVCLIGPSGSGKSTLLRCVNFLEPYDSGDMRIDGRLIGYEDAERNAPADGGASPARDAARDRHGVPAFQSLAAHDARSAMSPSRCGACADLQRARSGRARNGDADAGRARRQGRRLSVASLGRPAAARRHRPGAGDAAAAHAVRRADLGARSRAGRRSAGGDAEPRGGGHDHADRHPRDGLRRPCRRPHRLHRRGPHHRRGAAAPGLPREPRAARAAVPADLSRPQQLSEARPARRWRRVRARSAFSSAPLFR